MRGLAHGVVDGQPIFVGDQVLIRAEVVKSIAGAGVLVKLFSKTDEMQVWVSEPHLRWAVEENDLPSEPADQTWLLVHDDEGMALVFHRDDAEGHSDECRRHDEHWWDVVAQRWIDWPAAVMRGAAHPDVQRMMVEPPDA